MDNRHTRTVGALLAGTLLALAGALTWITRPRPPAGTVAPAHPDAPPAPPAPPPPALPPRVWVRMLAGLAALVLLLPAPLNALAFWSAPLLGLGTALALRGRTPHVIDRRFWARTLTLLALPLIAASALALADAALPLEPGLRLAGLSALALAGALALHPAAPLPRVRLALEGRTVWGWLGAGALALGLLTLYSTHPNPPPLMTTLQGVLLFGGAWAVAQGLAGEDTPLPRLPPAEGRALLLVTLLALGLRLWNLEYAVYTPALEAEQLNGILRLRDQSNERLLGPELYNVVPMLYPYLQAATAAAIGSTYTALRLISVILGTLTVPALYLLLRALLPPAHGLPLTPLIGALLLAAFPPHLHFSRVGTLHIAAPCFGTLALALLAHGTRGESGGRWALIGGGLALGMTPYFYPQGLLLFPALAALLLAARLVAVRAHPWDALCAVLLVALPALALALPLLATLSVLDSLPVQELGDLAYGIRRVLRLNETAFGPLTYGGDTPLLLTVLLPLVLAGVGVALARPSLWIVLLWTVGALMLPGASVSTLVALFPALAALAAIGLGQALPLLWAGTADVRARGLALTLTIAIVLAAGQAAYYIGAHLPRLNEQLRPGLDAYDVMNRAREYSPNTRVTIIGRMPDSGLLSLLRRYWRMRAEVYITPPEDVDRLYLERLPRDVNLAFFVAPGDNATVQLIRDLYIEQAGYRVSPFDVPLRRQYREIYVDTPYD